LPDINTTIWDKYRDQGLKVIGLYGNEDADLLADFAEQTGITFPFVQDINSTLWDFSFPPGVGYPYPRDVVVGKDLTVRSIHASFNVDDMDALVQQLLAE
jgi:hypothetical protein